MNGWIRGLAGWVCGNPGGRGKKKLLKTNKKLNEKNIPQIKDRIKKNCSPKHVPYKIIQVPDIPRTKSGKIVELSVKKAIHGEKIDNLQALANPNSLLFFKKLYENKILNEK